MSAAPTIPEARSTLTPAAALTEAHEVFRRWLGAEYDLDALDVVLAAAAVERGTGDPLWLLLLSGSGNAKTETVAALAGAGATVTSTITSQGALLSATSKRERTTDATGGLLRAMGNAGVLVIKDVTSILSMSRDMRSEVLAALREIYDGSWTRNVGTDGGRSLEWSGRLAVVGAVTSAWDRNHDVVAKMGDRFVIVRTDSGKGRQAAGRQAMGNIGHETSMRSELAEAVAGVVDAFDTADVVLTDGELETLLAAADLVTLARTGVDYDYQGNVIDANAPEAPTRFAKQIAQVLRGAVSIGRNRADALALALRCARDSIPPIRLAIIEDVAAHPDASVAEIRKRLSKPRTTVDRQCQALDILGVLESTDEDTTYRGRDATVWRYRVCDDIDPTVLRPEFYLPEKSVTPPIHIEEGTAEGALCPPTDKSGELNSPPSLMTEPLPTCKADGCDTRSQYMLATGGDYCGRHAEVATLRKATA